MSSKEIIAEIEKLEKEKKAVLEDQSIAGKKAREIAKKIDEKNKELMKVVMQESEQKAKK